MDEKNSQLMADWVNFRQDLRQILDDCGVETNPRWTEDQIVEEFRKITRIKLFSVIKTCPACGEQVVNGYGTKLMDENEKLRAQIAKLTAEAKK